MNYLIIVNGLPATGKTTLSTKLAESLKVPIFRKDDIKEKIADRLSNLTTDDSYRLGLISRMMLSYLAEKLRDDMTYIIDSNFSPGQETDSFVKEVKGLRVIEIFLKAEGEILFKRFANRTKERHPIHLEHHLDVSNFEKTITEGLLEPLNLGVMIEVDTTNFNSVNYDKIIDEVKSLLAE